MAVGVEAGAGVVFAVFDLPNRREAYIGVGAAQLAPLVLALAAAATIRVVKRRIARRVGDMRHERVLAVILRPTDGEQDSAVRMQAAFRGEELGCAHASGARSRASPMHHVALVSNEVPPNCKCSASRAPAGHLARARARRTQEVEAWQAARAERTIMTLFVYSGVVVAIGVLAYVCLLYGVKFDARQAESWVVGTLVGFVTDIFVQEPLVELIKVVVALMIMLCRSSLRGAVMNRIAAKRDAIKLALNFAQELRKSDGGTPTAAAEGDGGVAGAGAGAGAAPRSPASPAGAAAMTSPKAGRLGAKDSGESRAGEPATTTADRPVGVVDMLLLWPGRRSAARV